MIFQRNGHARWCLLAGIGIAGTLAAAGPAAAQSTPYLGYSDDGTISITRLPIKEPSGSIVYKDATITVTADTNGLLKAKVTKEGDSPQLPTRNVVAGVYGRLDNGNEQLRISGPGPLASGGEAKWTIVTVQGSPCGSPAEFYTGPLDRNPCVTTGNRTI